MINLFFIIHYYSGAITYANELLPYLSDQQGIAVHKIYLESKYYKEYTEIKEANILIIHIPAVKREAGSLKKYAKRCIDVITPILAGKKNVIFHLNYSTQVKFGKEARKKFGAKLVYTLQYLPNYFSYLGIDNTTNENLTTTGDVLDKKVIKEADKIICISKFTQNILCKQYNVPIEKTEIIYNGYGTIESKPPENTTWIKEGMGFDKKERLILFVGRLGTEKGLHALIHVFKKIVIDLPDARLVLAGEGNFKKTMKLCHNTIGKVTFTGSLKKEQLQKLYSIADIGVAPSHFELLGYVPIEMMFHRVPMIISNVPGMNELVKDGKNGLVCKVKKRTDGSLGLKIDKQSLYSKIKILLEDTTQAKKFAQHGRLSWENNFTAAHMGKATLKLYKQLQTMGNLESQKISNLTV